ncbi:MAG: hypothetical protein MJA32_13815 [Proteobacteria bacterium]|nr:hypothetical protein [Pseudomonadota bacterium]
MKFLAALLAGLLLGAASFGAVLLYNPLTSDRGLSPLSVSDAELITLNFSAVPSESIVYTNDGESLHEPTPGKVLQLWEAPIRQTSAMVTVMRDGRNRVAGLGVKLSSKSESTHLLHGEAIVDSVWYLYLPEHGSLFLQQSENYWRFIRDVAFPAWRSSANSWRGNWLGDLTAGPGALGTAAVSGGSGRVAGLEMAGVESLLVRAFSADTGLVSADGRLIIEFPEYEDVAATAQP